MGIAGAELLAAALPTASRDANSSGVSLSAAIGRVWPRFDKSGVQFCSPWVPSRALGAEVASGMGSAVGVEPRSSEGPAQLPAQSLVALTVPTNLQPVCASAARAASKVAALPCRSSPIADMDRNTQSSPACCRGTPSLICPAAWKRPQCRGRAGAVFGLCRLSGSTRRITYQPQLGSFRWHPAALVALFLAAVSAI